MEKDKCGNNYKCGPNWLPNWVFDEPLFVACCTRHDKDWSDGKPKLASDWRLLKCCLEISSQERRFWWRIRDKFQAYLMFFILLTNPVSYLYYWYNKIISK